MNTSPMAERTRSLPIETWNALGLEGNMLPVKITLDGDSMRPLIRRGKDPVTIIPVNRPLKKGDIVKWNKDGAERLCVIRGVSLPQFYCVPVCDARMKEDMRKSKCWYTPTLSAAFAGNMTKFRMDVLGELRRAND